MKLLLDQNVSAGAAEILRERGFDALHAREVALATADDPKILEWCRSAGRSVVTLDSDFHAHLALSGARAPSVIRIRIEGLRDAEMAALIVQIVAATGDDLSRGAAVSVSLSAIRVRALPLLAAVE